MLRRGILAAAIGLCLAALPALPAWAETRTEALNRAMRLDEVVLILRDEGLRSAGEMEADLADGGGQYFRDRIDRIYDTGVMGDAMRGALRAGMTDDEIDAVLEFFDTARGQRILTLENTARVAMADPDVEDIARATYADLDRAGDARLTAVARFVEINDLVERNVASALGSSYQFYRGLSEGGGVRMGEDDILTEVWAQEAELREDMESWLFGFLLLAYRPLSDADLSAYLEFSGSPAGQALNSALFAGFEVMYGDISYALGTAVALAMEGSDI